EGRGSPRGGARPGARSSQARAARGRPTRCQTRPLRAQVSGRALPAATTVRRSPTGSAPGFALAGEATSSSADAAPPATIEATIEVSAPRRADRAERARKGPLIERHQNAFGTTGQVAQLTDRVYRTALHGAPGRLPAAPLRGPP